MKKLQAQIIKRLVAAMLVTAAVIGLSGIAMQAPTHNQTSAAHSLKGIHTDKATLFHSDQNVARRYCVEMVLPGTNESQAAAENLKLIAAAF
jgi:hypothetical protein